MVDVLYFTNLTFVNLFQLSEERPPVSKGSLHLGGVLWHRGWTHNLYRLVGSPKQREVGVKRLHRCWILSTASSDTEGRGATDVPEGDILGLDF